MSKPRCYFIQRDVRNDFSMAVSLSEATGKKERNGKNEKSVGVGFDGIDRIGKHGSRKTTGMSGMQQGDDVY